MTDDYMDIQDNIDAEQFLTLSMADFAEYDLNSVSQSPQECMLLDEGGDFSDSDISVSDRFVLCLLKSALCTYLLLLDLQTLSQRLRKWSFLF